MDYELIKCLNTVRIVMINIRPIYHILLLQNKWSYCVLLTASPCPLYYFPFLLTCACTLYLHVCIIFTTVLYSSYQLMIYPLWLKLLYCYTVTVEIILYYECECVLWDEYMKTCLGGYLWGDVGGGHKQGIYINIWRWEIDYEYLYFNGYATYDHMNVIYNFALSTHLIVDTGCQLFLHMSYISMIAYLLVMYARACDRCIYGYAMIIYVIILSYQFHNYIDHTSTIIHLWPTISSTHFTICVNLPYIICSNGKVQREMHICLFVCRFILPGCGVLDQI